MNKPATGNNNEEERLKPLFSLGQIVATPGALASLHEVGQEPSELLTRHITGDWGDVCEEDRHENDRSLKEGWRILSAYTLENGVKVWIITEWDRRVTTILLPAEY